MNTENLMMIFGSNAVVALLTFIFSRRKQNAEIDTNVISNLEKSIMVYAKIIEDLKREIAELNIKIQELEVKIDQLKEENNQLRIQLNA
jgi:predicted RNase H-like nuclease (RuvC/YqgF family)